MCQILPLSLLGSGAGLSEQTLWHEMAKQPATKWLGLQESHLLFMAQ